MHFAVLFMIIINHQLTCPHLARTDNMLPHYRLISIFLCVVAHILSGFLVQLLLDFILKFDVRFTTKVFSQQEQITSMYYAVLKYRLLD